MTANTDVAERLRATVAKELKQDVSSITTEHTLRGDLKLNSLDAIELMFRIEEEFDLSIPDDDMQGFVKVGDVIDYLQRRLSGESGAPAPKAAAAPAAPAPPVFKTAAATQRETTAPKAAAARPRATPPPKAAVKKAKPKAARRRA
ncbi:MAG TPA: phosphopantetheine-binding protein [Methylomirabilota bacterium]|jgi:acyl carrier protein|nr:phosphopantetheine-binding protein [Methylomirabilota bacterium]